ncbi:MAPEG family protein [Devosia ginsengisoli]|uniref:MAPEG family protein n=1 Tax=Devosia ginsengisoli TaxID=400770 RepID=UPI0026EAD2CA|nr:MAPEG family protein [Devosia ginsengisoli]MCR6672632.1 MAPEG family protein [Devosia ginsengisoli]
MGAQLAPYAMSIVGVLALCLLSLVLAVYSGRSKGAAGALSGPVLDARDDNKLYRIDRVHMNSVEALTPFAVSVVIAMLVEVTPALLAGLVWLHVAIRLAHLVIYLRGGEAAKGGHLRTVLYVSSALVTMVLIIAAGWAALT